MTDIGDWYKNIPRFTKYWLSLTVLLSVLAKIRVIPVLSYEYLALNWYFLWTKFQIWRIVTALFYYPTGFQFLVNCYFLYSYSVRLEEYHRGTPSEYIFLLIFNYLCCLLICIIASVELLMEPMVLSVLYVWCQLNKDVTVTFWFGTQFKAVYLPWILLAFNFIMGGATYSIIGIVVGHLYQFLKYEYQKDGKSLLETPAILKKYFPNVRGAHGFTVFVPESQASTRHNNERGSNWGRGHVLGH